MPRHSIGLALLALLPALACGGSFDIARARDGGGGGPGSGADTGTGSGSDAGPRAVASFNKRVLDVAFRSEAVTAFDVDKDGLRDIVTYQYWYRAPDFTPHEIETPVAFDPTMSYSHGFAAFPDDINGDGYLDLVTVARNGEDVEWLENPRGMDVHWTQHVLAATHTIETAIYVDLFGDGRRELLMGLDPPRELDYFVPGTDPTVPWPTHAISAPGFAGAAMFKHGLGAGDVNGDGRQDVLTAWGWFEGNATPDAGPWRWHDTEWAPNDCAQLYAYDVNLDGRADVLCSSPHGAGVRWFEQGVAASGGEPPWTEHVIDSAIPGTHALRFEDLDGDGIPELITGRRFLAELGPMPPPGNQSLLAYYKLVRGGTPGNVQWERHDIDTDSGVGTSFEVTDVNGDGLLDIVVSNKKGLFYFEQHL